MQSNSNSCADSAYSTGTSILRIYDDLDRLSTSAIFDFEGSYLKDKMKRYNIILSGPKMVRRITEKIYNVCFTNDMKNDDFLRDLCARGNYIILLEMKSANSEEYSQLSCAHRSKWNGFLPPDWKYKHANTLFLACNPVEYGPC